MSVELLSISASALLVAVVAGWLWQIRSKNAGIADVIWAYGVGAASVFYAAQGPGIILYRATVGVIAGVWFARLGTHILLRLIREKHEDGRYRAIRERYGKRINVFHFFFFLAQAIAAWLFALPMWIISHNATPLTSIQFTLLLIAPIVVLIAFAGEWIADRQLEQFRANPANDGKTCRAGLWRYSRHPNYFFEWLHWFVYPLLAFGASYGTYIWLAPLLMFFFLYFFTGIPYTERQALRSRGEDYRSYQRTTSAFIPWRPKT